MALYNKKLELYIDSEVLTQESITEIINAILELLLYKRNQIPFVYKTYRYYIDKWSDNDEKGSSFQVERQKINAKTTRQSISAMKQLIRKIFAKESIKTVRFLFGSTTSTPKEVYTLHIPLMESPSTCNLKDHHLSPQKLNQMLLNLISNESLYGLFSTHLITTNIYLDLEILKSTSSEGSTVLDNTGGSLFCKQLAMLPPSCKNIHFHLIPRYNCPKAGENVHAYSCKDFEITEDMEKLSTNNRFEPTKKSVLLMETSAWWEAELFIRGFKEQCSKGINMWS